MEIIIYKIHKYYITQRMYCIQIIHTESGITRPKIPYIFFVVKRLGIILWIFRIHL